MTETMSIRIDRDARKGLTDVCKELGLSVSAAINVFAKKVAKDRKIPFELSAETMLDDGLLAFENLRAEAKRNNIQGMSLSDINKIISKTRKSIK